MSEDWSKDFYKLSDDLKECAIESVTTVLDSQADKVLANLHSATPRKTGALVNSLKKESANKGSTLGFKVRYDGYNLKGQPFQVIANALNKGFFNNSSGVYIPGTHFIDHSVSLLKGTNDLINDEWEKRIKERSK